MVQLMPKKSRCSPWNASKFKESTSSSIMRDASIPVTDSIQELAAFWDNHDITDYENDLNVVDEPVFERKPVIKIQLDAKEADVLSRMASIHGISCDEMIRNWVIERLHAA